MTSPGSRPGQAGVAAADAGTGLLGDQDHLGRAAQRSRTGTVDDDRPGAGLTAPHQAGHRPPRGHRVGHPRGHAGVGGHRGDRVVRDDDRVVQRRDRAVQVAPRLGGAPRAHHQLLAAPWADRGRAHRPIPSCDRPASVKRMPPAPDRALRRDCVPASACRPCRRRRAARGPSSPCVGAVVHDAAGRLLLIRRGSEPGQGAVVAARRPGRGRGDLAAAVEREVLEETGLRGPRRGDGRPHPAAAAPGVTFDVARPRLHPGRARPPSPWPGTTPTTHCSPTPPPWAACSLHPGAARRPARLGRRAAGAA